MIASVIAPNRSMKASVALGRRLLATPEKIFGQRSRRAPAWGHHGNRRGATGDTEYFQLIENKAQKTSR
jgi:hypothetical protein